MGSFQSQIFEKMRKFGLIGFPLSHSFSKKYFTEKFQELGIAEDNQYELYSIEKVEELKKILIENPELAGLNITIPHKLNILPLLHEIDDAAQRIGAVNVIKILENNKLKGYNSDYYGFKKSLEAFLGGKKNIKALVLGNGGASKAVVVALQDMGIEYKLVSRRKEGEVISYYKANDLLGSHHLVINCTPLGTYPAINECPDLDYDVLTNKHYFHDLIYNPGETLFMRKAKDNGANTKNGYDMLVFQAEKSWEIWNKK
jgi:shikimate dehydrogenase